MKEIHYLYIEMFSQESIPFSQPRTQKRVYSQMAETVPVSNKNAKVTVVKTKSKAYGKSTSKFAKAVMNVVKRYAEKKQQDQNLSNQIIGSSTALGFYYLLPDTATLTVPQGSGVASRIANRIRPVKLTYQGTIEPMTYDALTNPTPTPQLVTIWIVASKVTPNAPPNPSNVGANFFRNGSSPASIGGTPNDWCLPINTEDWTLYKKIVLKVGYAEFTTTGATAAAGNFANNDFQGCARFSLDLTKYCPAQITFDDATARPTSRQLMAVVEPVNAMGGGASGAATCLLSHSIQFTYEDV